MLVLVLAALLMIQLPDKRPEKAVEDGSGAGASAEVWETLEKLLAPDFSLVQPWPLQRVGSEPLGGRFSV